MDIKFLKKTDMKKKLSKKTQEQIEIFLHDIHKCTIHEKCINCKNINNCKNIIKWRKMYGNTKYYKTFIRSKLTFKRTTPILYTLYKVYVFATKTHYNVLKIQYLPANCEPFYKYRIKTQGQTVYRQRLGDFFNNL